MGAKRILLIEGHPDIQSAHLCGTLADAYAQGAQSADSARVVVTMGMPVCGLRNQLQETPLRHKVLGFVGIAPIHETLIGMVDKLGLLRVAQWSTKLHTRGTDAM